MVALIVTAAVIVKLVVLVQLWNHPLLQPHGELDTAYYVTLSQRVASEGVLAPIGAFFVSPLYVYFLAAVFTSGGSLLAAQLVQIALGAAAVGLLFASARHWFGERAALVAAGLAILTGSFTFNEILILQSALDPFLVSWALYTLTRAMAGGGAGAFAAAGASLGLLALNRPNALVFAVAVAGVVFVSQRCAVRPIGYGGRAGAGRPRSGAGDASPARRPRSQRGTQLRRVRRRRPDCLARRPQSLHRQPRSRRRDLHARAGHHSIDCRAGWRFDSRGGVECGPEPVAWRGVEVLCVAGIRLGHGASSRCSELVDSARSGFCSTASTFHSTTVTRSTRANHSRSSASSYSRSLAAATAWSGRPGLAGAAKSPRLLGLGNVVPVYGASVVLFFVTDRSGCLCSCRCAPPPAPRWSGISTWRAPASSTRCSARSVPSR